MCRVRALCSGRKGYVKGAVVPLLGVVSPGGVSAKNLVTWQRMWGIPSGVAAAPGSFVQRACGPISGSEGVLGRNTTYRYDR